MTERDLKKIQARAIEEGLPYQSLISILIHKYNEGKVSIQERHKKGKQPIVEKNRFPLTMANLLSMGERRRARCRNCGLSPIGDAHDSRKRMA